MWYYAITFGAGWFGHSSWLLYRRIRTWRKIRKLLPPPEIEHLHPAAHDEPSAIKYVKLENNVTRADDHD